MAETRQDSVLDAQAAAGPLGQVFALDVTTAVVVCASCGREGPFAELPLYGGGMGVVLRCRDCAEVLLRFVETPRGLLLEMQGLRTLSFPADGRI